MTRVGELTEGSLDHGNAAAQGDNGTALLSSNVHITGPPKRAVGEGSVGVGGEGRICRLGDSAVSFPSYRINHSHIAYARSRRRIQRKLHLIQHHAFQMSMGYFG